MRLSHFHTIRDATCAGSGPLSGKLARFADVAAAFDRSNPLGELSDDGFREPALVTLSRDADVPALSPKLCRNPWSSGAPVDEIRSDQDAVDLRVMSDVAAVCPSAFAAVVRVLLDPPTGVCVAVVDVVAKGLLEASAEIRTLAPEAWIVPVVVERQALRDLHNED
jgi:hypothetical protein